MDATNLAAEGNGPFGVRARGISIAVQLVVMLAAGLAAVSTHRGWLSLRST